MIWVVSKSLVASKEELDSRHQIIQEITQAKVTPWTKQCCIGARWPYRLIEFYQCTSQKGEYGLVITAHMNIEVQPILQQILSQKKALVVIVLNIFRVHSRPPYHKPHELLLLNQVVVAETVPFLTRLSESQRHQHSPCS